MKITDEMIEAGVKTLDDGWTDNSKSYDDMIRDVYLAMHTLSRSDGELRTAIQSALAHRYGDWVSILETALAVSPNPESLQAHGSGK